MTGTDLATRRRLEAAVRAHGAGRVQEAAAAYDELLRGDPGNADLMRRFGAALAELGRMAEGEQWMARSLELQPDRPTVLVNLARALLALGQHEAALNCSDRAVSLDGAMAVAYRVRAAALTTSPAASPNMNCPKTRTTSSPATYSTPPDSSPTAPHSSPPSTSSATA